jgi:hypothetical protein|tara:strand:+ start:13773 stop:14399 length:627 start_codon:yes stop_codon:yes gene_type:complete
MKQAVHISIMTGKLLGLKSISTNTKTNEYCIKQNNKAVENKTDNICGVCYSHKMLDGFRKNMAPALQRNSDILSSRPLTRQEIPRINDSIFRFNAHGELINMQHLENLMAIVIDNPWCIFALWTKRVDYIFRHMKQHDKPKNLQLIYSNPKMGHILSKPPKYFDKTFNNVDVNDFVERQNCTGQKCQDCRLCYSENNVDTIIEKVKRY